MPIDLPSFLPDPGSGDVTTQALGEVGLWEGLTELLPGAGEPRAERSKEALHGVVRALTLLGESRRSEHLLPVSAPFLSARSELSTQCVRPMPEFS